MAKKLLEESVISRFQKLANINGGKGSLLTESAPAGGARNPAGGRATAPDLEEAHHMEEEGIEEADDAGMELNVGDEAGDEMDATPEGGDLEDAAEALVADLNRLFIASGLNKEVELDTGSEESEEHEDTESPEMEDEGHPMMERKHKKDHKSDKKVQDEDLEESIQLVDDTLIEKLVSRVSARLVAEARKARALAEGKKGSSAKGWEAHKPKHHKAPTKGKGNATKSGAGKPFGTKK